MQANEMEITTADKIIINRGSEDFPETDLYIWQPSLMKYRRIKMGQPTVDLSQQIIAEMVYRLFKLKAVEDYTALLKILSISKLSATMSYLDSRYSGILTTYRI